LLVFSKPLLGLALLALIAFPLKAAKNATSSPEISVDSNQGSLLGYDPGSKLPPLESKISFSLVSVCNKNKCEPTLPFDAPINKNTVEKFEQSTISIPAGTIVLLQSTTGDLNSGIKLGKYIRDKQFNTAIGQTKAESKVLNQVDGQCFSACLLAFAGGVNRRVDPGNQLGFYALRANSKSLSDGEFKTAVSGLALYLDQMGVDRRLVNLMLQAKGSSEQLISLSNSKLLNLTNGTNKSNFPWRIQALDDGSLIALATEKQNSNQFNVTLGLTRQNKDYRLTIFIKPVSDTKLTQLSEFLEQNGRPQLQISNKVMVPTVIKPWEATGIGIQSAALMSEKEMLALSSVLEFELSILQLAGNPFGLDKNTTFGTSGLKGALIALKK
jgi:hypothetical protein